jgi:flagellar biosynthesis/type III secretory pathway ATPase
MINGPGKHTVKTDANRVTISAVLRRRAWRGMKALAEQINELDGIEIYGRVVGVRGLMVEVAGPLHAMSVGARVIVIETGGKLHSLRSGRLFRQQRVADAVRAARRGAARLPGAVTAVAGAVRPSPSWLGRVVNALGEPIDGKGPLAAGPSPIRSATRRRRRMRAAGSARRSISACARSIPS